MYIVRAKNKNTDETKVLNYPFYNLPQPFESEAGAKAEGHAWQMKLGDEWLVEVIQYGR